MTRFAFIQTSVMHKKHSELQITGTQNSLYQLINYISFKK